METLNPKPARHPTAYAVAGATERLRGYGQALLGCKACLTAKLGACPGCPLPGLFLASSPFPGLLASSWPLLSSLLACAWPPGSSWLPGLFAAFPCLLAFTGLLPLSGLLLPKVVAPPVEIDVRAQTHTFQGKPVGCVACVWTAQVVNARFAWANVLMYTRQQGERKTRKPPP